ncbi:TPA: hypothetical protein ACHJXR_004953, partial [Escherichia coli]
TSGEKRVFLVILFTSFSGSLVSRIPGAVQTIMNNVIFDWYLSRQKFIQRPLPRCNRQSP